MRPFTLAVTLTGAILSLQVPGTAIAGLPSVPRLPSVTQPVTTIRAAVPAAGPTFLTGTSANVNTAPPNAAPPNTAQPNTATQPGLQVLSGQVSAVSGNTITVSSANGQTAAITLAPNLTTGANLPTGSTVLAISNDGGRTVHIFIVPSGTRLLDSTASLNGTTIFGQIVGVTQDQLALLMPDGQVAQLFCACQSLTGGIGLGDNVLAQVDAHAHVTALAGVKSGNIVGTIIAFSPTYIRLRTSDGREMLLNCACMNGTLAGTPLRPNMRVVAAIGRDARIVHIAPLDSLNRVSGQLVSYTRTKLTIRLPSGAMFAIGALPTQSFAYIPQGAHVVATFNPDGTLAAPKPNRDCIVGKKGRTAQQCEPGSQKLASTVILLPQLRTAAEDCSRRSLSLVSVQVNSALTQLPLYHASIRLYGNDRAARVLSSEQGYAVFDDVPPGTYRVVVGKSGLREAASEAFRVECRRSVALRARLAPVLEQSARRTRPI